MAIKRKGNSIEFTGKDASNFAKEVLPSMRYKEGPGKRQFTVKVKFNTARACKNRSITGSGGFGEVDIWRVLPFDPVKAIESTELKVFCTNAIQSNPKIKGNVVGLEILEIVEKGQSGSIDIANPPVAKPRSKAKPSGGSIPIPKPVAPKDDAIKWVPGKMVLEPNKTYAMEGKELIDMGKRVDSDGFLIGNKMMYSVRMGMPWSIKRRHP